MTSASIDIFLQQFQTTNGFRKKFHQFGIRYRWYALATLTLANVAVLMSSTVVSVAIPQIMGAFGIGQDEAQWLSTGNLVAATIAMLMSAWMVQAFGMRYTLVSGLLLFTLGSLLGGLAPNILILNIGRVLQGITVGIVGPLLMSVIFQLFPAKQQGLAMGVTSIGVIMAPTLGPGVGGFLVDHFNWRYVIFLGIPFSIICIPLSWILFPDREQDTDRPAFDWLGFIALTVSITSLLIALNNGEKEGWLSNISLAYFCVSLCSAFIFIHSQRYCDYPVLELNLFRNRQYTILSLVSFVFGAGLYASMYIVPVFLQMIQGMSPTDSGLIIVPAGIAMTLVFPISGRLADKVDTRILITTGSVLFAASFYLMTQSDRDTGFWLFACWLILGRIGLAVVLPPLNIQALKVIRPEQLQQGSGAINFSRQLGGAFGVSLITMILTRRSHHHRDALFSTQQLDNDSMLEWIRLSRETLGEAGLTGITQVSVALRWLSQAIYQQALTLGFQDAFLMVAVAFLVTLVPTWLLTLKKA